MTTREKLHDLIDQLPEEGLPAAERFLETLGSGQDPVLSALLQAPEDDEPETPEEISATQEARARMAAGGGMRHEEARRRLLPQS